MKVVVIIPTYNEKENIERMINVLESDVFPKIPKYSLEILVADDNSPDGTADIVKTLAKKWKNITLLMGEKKGLGAAYAKAMQYAMNKMGAYAVIELDADFQHDPNEVIKLVKAMDDGADYVIGSRYIPGGKIPKEWGIHRKFLSFFGSLFARIVFLRFDIHDMTSGLKLTKTEFLQKVDLNNLLSNYYAYKIHILYEMLQLKAKIKEVPIVFHERKKGTSKIETKDLFDSFRVVMRLRIRESKRFIKFLIVGGTGFTNQVLWQELSVFLGVALFLAEIFYPSIGRFFHVTNVIEFKNIIAVAIGAEAAIISNFLINNFWTFQDTRRLKEKSHVLVRMIKFNAASLISFFIQLIAATVAIAVFGVSIPVVGIDVPTRLLFIVPTIIFLVIPINYFIYNKIIWKTQYLSNNEDSKKS
jgi:dolichol-phosphate mannosyltransferase